MKFHISSEISFRILRFVGQWLGIWPLSDGNKKKRPDYIFWFAFVNYVFVLLPLWYGLYVNRRNISAVIFSWIDASGFTEVMVILIYGKLQRSHLQVLIIVVENQVTQPKSETIKKYAHFYAKVYVIILIFYSTVVVMYMFLVKPEGKNGELMLTAVYPFKIESQALRILLYSNQVFILLYSCIIPAFDGIAVLLIFTCTERLKTVAYNFEISKDFEELKYCIQDHANCLSLVKKTNHLVRFIVLKTIFSFISNVLGSGLMLFNNPDPSQWIHFFIMLLVYSRIYLSAESADNMSLAGKDVEYAVYSTEWYNEDPKIVAMKAAIICRCQGLPEITMSGFMTSLNRSYLASILWATVSYLMTLRTVIGTKY